ncbi:DUF6141 family protein [Methanolacinia paynteri]|uniref:DUF6141 family protein n=1 Tax=Methanolacinia paynteri TaxID=230356 RepID=UPI00069442FE|nr:DUF6141 family protein [Methanolacinia paynteri]
MKKEESPAEFYEAQYMAKDQPLMAIVVWAITIFSWGVFAVQVILGIPVGNNPAPDSAVWVIMIVFGILFPLFMFTLRLETKVMNGVFGYRYFPVHLKWRNIKSREIKKAEVVDYSGLREFGGWGIRWNRRGKAYTVAGRGGVRFTLKGKKEILFGSKRPEELLTALNRRSE